MASRTRPPALATTLALGLACVACVACVGAADLSPLSTDHIAESGTLRLHAPRQLVVDACVLALRKQGYAIDVVGPEPGLVVTVRRAEPRSALGARLFRAYVLEIKDGPAGTVEVAAWPAVSQADLTRGTRPYTAPAWDLDEERDAWARLFGDVRAIVVAGSP